ncbi:AAD14_9 [Sanghuangporus vaninii]
MSPLELGVMSIGDKWAAMPSMDKDQDPWNVLDRGFEREIIPMARAYDLALITAIAIAYVMQKAPYVFLIIGGRQIQYLEGIVPHDFGFPYNFIMTTFGLENVPDQFRTRKHVARKRARQTGERVKRL